MGGKATYPSDGPLYQGARDPRLFQCSNASGAFLIEEIFNFSQEDLDQNDVFLLDTWSEVFIWVGDKSNAIEKKLSVDSANDYIKNAEDGRPKECPVVQIRAGNEPPMFTAHFLGWNLEIAASKADPTAAKLAALKGPGTSGSASSSSAAPGSK